MKSCIYAGKYGSNPVYKKGNKFFAIQAYGNQIEINEVKKRSKYAKFMKFEYVKNRDTIHRGLAEGYGGLNEKQAIQLGKKNIECR